MKLLIRTKDAKKFLETLKDKEGELSEIHKKINRLSNFSESPEEKRQWYVEDNRLGIDDGNGNKDGLQLIAESEDNNRLVFSSENQIVTSDDEAEIIRLFQDLTYFLISGYIEDVEFFSVTFTEK